MIKYGIKEDMYHNILIEEHFNTEYRRVHVNSFEDIREFLFPTFDGIREVVLEIEDINLIKMIESRAYSGWNIVILVDRLSKIKEVEDEDKLFKVYKTYQDKKEFMERRLLKNRFVYKNKGIRDIMVRSLIIDPTKLKDVYRFHDYVGDNYTITEEDIEGIFGGVEHHNLDDTCLAILTLRYKNKVFKQVDYFIEERGYSSRWLLGKLKEKAMDLDYMYYLYLRGYILVPVGEREYTERLQSLGKHPRESWYGYGYQQKLLNIVKTLDYNLVKKIIQVVLEYDVYSDSGLYGLLLKIKVLGEEEGLYGIFNRQVYRSK